MSNESNPPEESQQDSTGHVPSSTPGIIYEPLYHRRIIAFTFSDLTPETVNFWFGQCLTAINNFPADRSLMALHDLSAPTLALNNYVVERCRALLKARGSHPIRQAVVVSQSLMENIIRAAIRPYLDETASVYICYHRQEGLAWLREHLTR